MGKRVIISTQGPHLGPGLWMVGDSIFPGQSVPAVALGGLRVAGRIMQTSGHPAQAPSRTEDADQRKRAASHQYSRQEVHIS